MHPRSPVRWKTTFARFVAQETVPKVISGLAARGIVVTRGAVYQWVAGRTSPRPRVAAELVQLSCGRLTLDEVYKRAD